MPRPGLIRWSVLRLGRSENWSDAGFPLAFSHLCYSDISYLYAGRGLAEGLIPYEPADHLPVDQQPASAEGPHAMTVEYPVLTGLWMGVAGAVTHLVGHDAEYG